MKAKKKEDFVDVFQCLLDTEGLEDTPFQTPDEKRSKPFRIAARSTEGIDLRLSTGGRMRLEPFVFDFAYKFLRDCGFTGDKWLEVKDPTFADVLKEENGGKACASYVLPILEKLSIIEIDRGRPNKVRLKSSSPAPEASS